MAKDAQRDTAPRVDDTGARPEDGDAAGRFEPMAGKTVRPVGDEQAATNREDDPVS
jgi:hypothetical protein